jgi:hypothetical protein
VQSIDDLICSVLRGDRPAWPVDGSAAAEALLQRAQFHGVGVLLHHALASLDWPLAATTQLRQYALQCTMWELRHHHILNETLRCLTAAGIEPVLVKGTVLAYWLYAGPALRTRGDTDLIVPIAEKRRTHELLLASGYQQGHGVSGEFVSYQSCYTKLAPEGSAHTLDVHWKINNSELLSRLFSYEELRHAAQPLPKLGPDALGSSLVHALLLACMHRATHRVNPYHVDGHAHHTADRLIWLYDIHLLAGAMQPNQWDEFLRLGHAKGLRAVCLDGMTGAQRRFGTRYPIGVIDTLGAAGTSEPPSDYLVGSRFRQQWMDFWALGGTVNRLRFMRELMFPPAAYMRGKYPESQPLPWLYVRRGLSGVTKSLSRMRSPS